VRPVWQSETELGRGDCLAACVASILELPIEAVPNFRLMPDQWGALQDWLGGRGLFAVRVVAEPECVYPVPDVDCILVGDSPRNPVLHAVVGRASGREWAMTHDPHPDGTGIAGRPVWLTFFGIKSPEKHGQTDIAIVGHVS
jgi:hypothetical protein